MNLSVNSISDVYLNPTKYSILFTGTTSYRHYINYWQLMNTALKNKNLEQKIIAHWGGLDKCAPLEEIIEQDAIIGSLKVDIKTKKEEKQLISKAFKDQDINDEQRKTLQKKMQLASQELKPLQKKLKQLESSLKLFFQEQPTQPPIPKRFLPQETLEQTGSMIISSHVDKKSWDQYVLHHQHGTIYHLSNWWHIISESFGYQTTTLVATDNQGRYLGVFPFTHIHSNLFGSYNVSMPYVNYGGPLANSKNIAKQLLDKAANICQEKSIAHLEVRSTQVLNDWHYTENKISMILSLPKEQQLLDSNLGAKVRAQINNAKKHGLISRSGGIELLDDFYKVFAINMRDLGTPVYSKKFFTNIFNAMQNNCSLTLLYFNNKPISAAFLIGHHDVLEIPWASTLRKFNKMNANMLLYREILGNAIDNNYAYFDFGRSSKDANTYRFKKQWGAKPIQHYWHYWLADRQSTPELNPNNPKYKLAIKIWQILPVWLTKIMGPSIVKKLP